MATEKYTDKNGVEKYATKIILQNFNGNIILLGSKSDNQQADDSGQYKPLPQSSGGFTAELDDDIPF